MCRSDRESIKIISLSMLVGGTVMIAGGGFVYVFISSILTSIAYCAWMGDD